MKKSNSGMTMGLIGGLIVILLYLFNMYILVPIWNGGNSYAYAFSWSTDLLVWVLQCILFYALARSAAEQQYRFNAAEEYYNEPFAGVIPAAMGAALITWAIGWLFVVVRAIIQDINGYTILIEPISTFCSVTLTALLALGLGNLAGTGVVKKYRKILED